MDSHQSNEAPMPSGGTAVVGRQKGTMDKCVWLDRDDLWEAVELHGFRINSYICVFECKTIDFRWSNSGQDLERQREDRASQRAVGTKYVLRTCPVQLQLLLSLRFGGLRNVSPRTPSFSLATIVYSPFARPGIAWLACRALQSCEGQCR